MKNPLSVLAYLYLRLVGATSRVLWIGRDVPRGLERRGRNFVYALWHSQQALLAGAHRGEPISILVSRSKDGEIIAGALELLGLRTARGSSSRGGGQAVLELIAAGQAGLHAAVTPDGPRGPARKVKPGALFLAQKLGSPIVPIAAAARSKVVFKRAWDRFELPLPFNRIVIAHGDPVFVKTEDSLEAKAAELEAALDAAASQAQRLADEPGAGLLLFLYDLAFPLLALGLIFKLLLTARRTMLKDLPRELEERLGGYHGIPAHRSVLWVHAASLGEVKSLTRVLDGLRASVPDPFLLVTTSTQGGKAAASKLPGVDAAFLAPLDFGPVARRALRRVRPAAYCITETEIWPNTLAEAARGGARLLLINGRLSAKSARGYAWIAPLVRESLAGFDRLCAQTADDAARLAEFGARPDRILVAGNLKHDLLPKQGSANPFQGLGWAESAPVWVAGSTRKGEEELVLEAYETLRAKHPELKLVLAPRHVERSAKVAKMFEARGLPYVYWSRAKAGGLIAPGSAGTAGLPPRLADGKAPPCLLVDRIGHLIDIYAGASFVFVGGTLVPKGGHNVLEPAALGKPVLFGPHTETVHDLAQGLTRTGGGRYVAGAAELAAQVDSWLEHPAALERAGKGALKACLSFQGATERTLAILGPRLAA